MLLQLLVDTDVMIDFLRGLPEAVDLIQENSTRIALPAIVVAELYAGVRNQSEQAVLDHLFKLFPVFSLTPEIARTAGLLTRDYGKSHATGLADAVIAATATATQSELTTLNTRHYPMFPNLASAYKKA
ncbi:PIN domain-containing protein [Spirochaeta dissipatitropha]